MPALLRIRRARTEVATVSTESIVSPSSARGGTPTACAACAAPLAGDQRYCLECGERRQQMSGFLFSGAAVGTAGAPASPPPVPPASAVATVAEQRGNTAAVIAGVGVLLLAMGVGVLIGRSNASKPAAAQPQVITVGSVAGASAGAAAPESFTDDWPAGTQGYTVQLQALPQAGTTLAQVNAAKAAASAKGAKGVGALKSEDFASLPAGSYVIYAGVDHTKAAAEKVLAGLKKSFPGASVVRVAKGNAGAPGPGSQLPGGAGGSGGSSLSHPAPPSVLESTKGTKGKSYEEKSKNLPNVVSTG
jgi:hypothetical protein